MQSLYLKKAIQLDGENPTYYFNLASAYEYDYQFDLAIRNYKQALLRKPNDFEIVEKTSILYYKLENFENAWNTVEMAMNKQQHTNRQVRLLFIKLLVQLAVIHNAKFEMKIALKYAKKFVDEVAVEREESLAELCKLCIQLANNKRFEGALAVIDWIVSLDESHEYKELQNKVKEDILLHSEFDELFSDECIMKEIRLKAHLFLYGEDMEDFDEQSDFVNERVLMVCEYEPEIIISSINRMKVNYPTMYSQISSWLEKIDSYARER